MANYSKHCLICYRVSSKVKYKATKQNSDKIENQENHDSRKCVFPNSSAQLKINEDMIDKQVSVIFVLRRLLKIPTSSLEYYLKISGGEHPDSWIELCDECGDEVEKTRRLFEEIVRASCKFKLLQKQVVEKVKESFDPVTTTKVNPKRKVNSARIGREEVGRLVTEESRNFVCEHDYGYWTNPIDPGDLEAACAHELVKATGNTQNESQIKQEAAGDDDLKEESSQFYYEDPESYPDFEDPQKDLQDDPDYSLPCSVIVHETRNDHLVKTNEPTGEGHRFSTSGSRRKPPISKSKLLEEEEGAFLEEGTNRVLFRCPLQDCGKIIRNYRHYQSHKLRHSQHPGLSGWKRLRGRKILQEAGAFLEEGTNKVIFQCQVEGCGKIIRNKRHFQNHKLLHSSGRLRILQPGLDFTTRIATETTTQISNTRRKKRKLLEEEGAFLEESTNKVIFRCQVEGCGKIVRTKRHFQNHKLLHSTSQGRLRAIEVTCNECGGVFGSQVGLARHMTEYHKKERDPSLYKIISSDKILARHRTREKCPHCGVAIAKYSLKTHIRIVHEKLYSVSCELCGKAVRGKAELRYHQAYHHFMCSVEDCKLSLGSRNELYQHQINAHGHEVDVFACPECGKLFLKRKVLRQHMLAYGHRKAVAIPGGKQEVEGSGGGGQFVCELCGKRFVLKEYLKYHIWHTHNKLRKKKNNE